MVWQSAKMDDGMFKINSKSVSVICAIPQMHKNNFKNLVK